MALQVKIKLDGWSICFTAKDSTVYNFNVSGINTITGLSDEQEVYYQSPASNTTEATIASELVTLLNALPFNISSTGSSSPVFVYGDSTISITALNNVTVAPPGGNSDVMTITETTSAYNPVSNVTGWGTSGLDPNPQTSDASQATLYIVTPSGTSHNVSVYPTLPSDSFGRYSVSPSALGYTSKLPDGYYQVQYEVQGTFGGNSGVLSSEKKQILLYGSVYCCIQKMSIQDDCECDDSDLSEMLLLFEAMKAADECCDIVCAKKILTELTRRCAKKCNC